MDLLVFLSLSRSDKREYLLYLQREFRIDHCEIANLLGMTREGIYKMMSDLEVPHLNDRERGVVSKAREQKYSQFKLMRRQVYTDQQFSLPNEVQMFIPHTNRMAEQGGTDMKNTQSASQPNIEPTTPEPQSQSVSVPTDSFRASFEVFGTLESINKVLRDLYDSEKIKTIDAARIIELVRV